MSTFYTTFLSKSDFSFVLLLVTFEPLEVEQSYIPLLKALICGINVVGAQGCSCMSTFCHAPLKIAYLSESFDIGLLLFLSLASYQQNCIFSHKMSEPVKTKYVVGVMRKKDTKNHYSLVRKSGFMDRKV